MRRHIQRGYDFGGFTRTSLAAESGVNLHTIDSIVSHDAAKHRRIACEDALNLAYTLGEVAVSALLGCIRYTASRASSEDMQPAQMVAQILPHVAVIAGAAADNRIDHTEVAGCRDAADHIISIVTPLSSAANN